jgi:hypothetical protein
MTKTGSEKSRDTVPLKGHGMRQIYDFFLYKLVRQRSLTQVLKRLRFQLLIRENICYQKSTPHCQRHEESM